MHKKGIVMIEGIKEIGEFYKLYLGIQEPYPYQLKVWSKIKEVKSPLLIRAPTGSGKTEAVVAPFLSQFVENKFTIAPRLIYVLPMRVLVNNITERIKKYAHSISDNIAVKIQHGDIPDSPFFISDIVVTTLDQFVYGFARVSHQVGRHIDIPAGAIASSFIVFDEAHMYRDGFTFAIMRAIMEILYKSNVPFVVMTATMPESLERSLFENINLKEENKIMGDSSIKSEVKIKLMRRPLVNQTEIFVEENILNKMKSKKTLIVLNQVKRAQSVYKEIKKRLGLSDDEIVLLHSRFTRKDRDSHEKKAIEFMKDKRKGVRVVVSTQVLEAGIDISAELLLTEIAPADAIVQRSGRCARYDGEKGEILIFPVVGNKSYLPYPMEDIENTLNWLMDNPDFNIKDFNAVSEFVNVLKYEAKDYEARDSLIDLYECVLYADTKPRNIQVRKGKPVTLLVIDESLGIEEGKKKQSVRDIIKNAFLKTDFKKSSISTDIGVAWGLFKNKMIRWEVVWNYNQKEKKNKLDIVDLLKSNKNVQEEDPRIAPFRVYILSKNNYSELTGIEKDESTFI